MKSVTSPGLIPPLSIRARLNLLIGALLVLAFAINLIAIVLSAGPRIRAESENMLKLTRQTVEQEVSEIAASADPVRDLTGLLERLSDIRHARVALEPLLPELAQARGARLEARPEDPPEWFSRLFSSKRPPVRIPIAARDTLLGTIVITSSPAEETAEIWEAVKGTTIIGLILLGAAFALMSLAIGQALRPIDKLGMALQSMEGGNYKVAVEPSGPPELAAISRKLNDLAQALTRTQQENRRLTGEIVSIEDRERRELARELHDEFGPYLFSIRANVTAMQAAGEGGQAADFAAKREAALDQLGQLQQVNRRVLQRLRPPALTELGLDGALKGLIAQWQDSRGDVDVKLSTNLSWTALDDTTALTVYRVVQEGLTNAFRHAQASSILVSVATAADGPIQVRIKDDGVGMSAGMRPGFGLSGMSERVWALGGTLSLANAPDGGVELDVRLPVARGAG